MSTKKIFIVYILVGLFLCKVNSLYSQKYAPKIGSIYHGVGWDYKKSKEKYANMMPDSLQPLMTQIIFGIPGSPVRPFKSSDLTIPIQAAVDNKQFVSLAVAFQEGNKIAVDTTFYNTTAYDHYMDTVAKVLNMFSDQCFTLRIGLEANGPWNNYNPYLFPKAFRKLVDGLKERGVTNFATNFCYEPDAPYDIEDKNAFGEYKWWPGEDYVDWCGLDLFDIDHFDPSLPDSALKGGKYGLTKKGKTERYIQFAESINKPIYLNELSAKGVNIVPDNLDTDSSEGKSDWELWFEPFFEFLGNHPSIKGFNYINQEWNTITQYATWGDARLEINSYIKNKWIEKISDPKFVHAGQIDICEQDGSNQSPIYPNIDSIKAISTVSDDSFLLITYTHFLNSPCQLVLSDIQYNGDEILVYASYITGIFTAECNAMDTFPIKINESNLYKIIFYLVDSIPSKTIYDTDTIFLQTTINQNNTLPNIDSLKIISNSENNLLISYTIFPNSPCDLVNSSIDIRNDSIIIFAQHIQGLLHTICNSIDTFILGDIDAGIYRLYYYLVDSIDNKNILDVDSVSFEIKSDFSNVYIDNIHTSNVKIYPNPFSGYTTLEISQNLLKNNINVIIYNMLGQEVKRINTIGNQTTYLSFEDLPTGVYQLILYVDSILFKKMELLNK